MKLGWLFVMCAAAFGAETVIFPTKNTSLREGKNEAFFCAVDRIENGVHISPWESGSYGMVRSPIVWQGQQVMTQFHEGIDILPLERDSRGEPLDVVGSISEGKVVHVSDQPRASNYGRYVVVEHHWSGTPIYSLYAHFARVLCKVGQVVKAGDSLGVLGHTGAGINLKRSHVHLEINLMCSENFNDFLTGPKPETPAVATNVAGASVVEKPVLESPLTRHGNFHGVNLMGYDAAAFFRGREKNPQLKFVDFVKTLPCQYKIFVANRGEIPEMARRYPWLLRGEPSGLSRAKSWEISFTATGQVIAFTPSERLVSEPTLGEVRPANAPLRYLTRGIVRERGAAYELSPGGKKLARLVSGDFPREEIKQPATPTL